MAAQILDQRSLQEEETLHRKANDQFKSGNINNAGQMETVLLLLSMGAAEVETIA